MPEFRDADDAPESEREFDANGHLLIGPRLKQPSYVRLIGAAERTPTPDTPAVAHGRMAIRRTLARRSLQRRPGGIRALAAAIRGAAA